MYFFPDAKKYNGKEEGSNLYKEQKIRKKGLEKLGVLYMVKTIYI